MIYFIILFLLAVYLLSAVLSGIALSIPLFLFAYCFYDLSPFNIVSHNFWLVYWTGFIFNGIAAAMIGRKIDKDIQRELS